MIFDTDVLIGATRGDPSAGRVIDVTTNRALSIISFMELLQGARPGSKLVQFGSRSWHSGSESCLDC